MGEDKLEEAKQYFRLTLNSVITEYGIGLGRWLISELERVRRLLEIAIDRAEKAEAKLEPESMEVKNVIPEMVHSLSKYWNQPDIKDIEIGDKQAKMSKCTFELLLEYSTSIPTGVYEGKMWKRRRPDAWYLLWYAACEGADSCSINIRKIIIVE